MSLQHALLFRQRTLYHADEHAGAICVAACGGCRAWSHRVFHAQELSGHSPHKARTGWGLAASMATQY